MDKRPLLITLLFFSSMLAGCFGNDVIENEEISSEYDVYPEPWQRSDIDYSVNADFSRVTVNGTFGIDEVRSVFVPVPSITLSDGGAGVTGSAEVHLGLWLPVIEGCDWESAELPDDCHVPIISEIGPYYIRDWTLLFRW